jgi:DNA invertase Pin-like site-specific DNA recombinase
MNGMKKVAIYSRVSTKEQDPDSQLFMLREYAKSRKFAIYREYVDRISGDTEERAEYKRLLEDVRKRKVDIVLVWRFDRFARSTRMLLAALDEFRNLGVDFISYHENIDTTSPLGRAIFVIVSAIAEFEKELIVQRVKAGLAKAKLKGKKLGRPPLTPEQKESILAQREQNLSIRQIATRERISIGVVHKYLRNRKKII